MECKKPVSAENWKFWTSYSMFDYCWGESSWAYKSSCLLSWSIGQLDTFVVNWFLLSRISWLHFFGHLGAHLFLYFLLWLGICCFKLNFWILFQLNISSFGKSIFRVLLVTKFRILINSLPFSSRHVFSLLSFISTIFTLFSIFNKAWINFMIPNNGIHKINSCEIN